MSRDLIGDGMLTNVDEVVEQHISVGTAAKLAGRDKRTIRRWADKGLVRARLSPGGHREISLPHLIEALNRSPSDRRRQSPAGPVHEVVEAWAEQTVEWYGWKPPRRLSDERLVDLIRSVRDLRRAIDAVEDEAARELSARDQGRAETPILNLRSETVYDDL